MIVYSLIGLGKPWISALTLMNDILINETLIYLSDKNIKPSQ